MRDQRINAEILRQFNRCKFLSQNNFHIDADIRASEICNNYFSEEIFYYEKEIIISLINIFFKSGNVKNAKKLISVIESMGEKKSLKSDDNKLFPFIEPVISTETIYKIRNFDVKDDELGSDGRHYIKYARDFEENYFRALATFSPLYKYENLIEKTNLSFLDIGTGFGLIPYIFKKNLFHVETIDMDKKPDYFDYVIKILGLKQLSHTIKKYEQIPRFEHKFDLINASQICFNGHATNELWDVDEWKFFLFDMHDNFLNKEGAIYLSFNYEQTIIDNKLINLGKESVETFFQPYIDKEKFPHWKIARLSKADIAKLKK
jgi:hypothetical protein